MCVKAPLILDEALLIGASDVSGCRVHPHASARLCTCKSHMHMMGWVGTCKAGR